MNREEEEDEFKMQFETSSKLFFSDQASCAASKFQLHSFISSVKEPLIQRQRTKTAGGVPRLE